MSNKATTRRLWQNSAKNWDFQFRGVLDSRKGFARLVEEISEDLTTSTTNLKVLYRKKATRRMKMWWHKVAGDLQAKELWYKQFLQREEVRRGRK